MKCYVFVVIGNFKTNLSILFIAKILRNDDKKLNLFKCFISSGKTLQSKFFLNR